MIAETLSKSEITELTRPITGETLFRLGDIGPAEVYVYSSLTEVERFTMAEVLTGGKILPGFSVPVAELFAAE